MVQSKIEINEDLRQKIISKIPAGLTKVQTCVFVYAELCRTLEYSMDYYVNEKEAVAFYEDPKNLKLIDGESRKDVVCFTFDAIYQEIVNGLELDGTFFTDDCKFDFSHGGKFPNRHHENRLIIDGVEYKIDASYGILSDNDLVDLKFAGRGIKNFNFRDYYGDEDDEDEDLKTPEEIHAELEEAKKIALQEGSKLETLASDYIAKKGEEYGELVLQERFNLFMKMIKHVPEYSTQSLNYLLNLKNSLFKKDELRSQFPQKAEAASAQNFAMSFVGDMESREVKVIIMFNPKGHQIDKGAENDFDSMQIYELELKDMKTTQYSVDEFVERLNGDRYYDPASSHGVVFDSIKDMKKYSSMLIGHKDLENMK